MTVAEVEAVAQAWADGVANKDAAAIARLYADDAKFLAPNAEPVEGRAAIEEAVSGMMTQLGAKSIKIEPVEVKEGGDLTVEYGRYTLEMEPEGADSITDVGKYIIVHEITDDGSPKIVLDIFNSNSPAP
jgi:uncharacterized protein (TIGR02246 family)